jgi:ribosome maturation protein Sdo1
MRKRKTDAERLADAGRIIADGNRENVRLRQRVRELERGETREIKRWLGLLKETNAMNDELMGMIRDLTKGYKATKRVRS